MKELAPGFLRADDRTGHRLRGFCVGSARPGIAALLLCLSSTALGQNALNIPTNLERPSEPTDRLRRDAERPPIPETTLAAIEAVETFAPATFDQLNEIAIHNSGGSLPLQNGFVRPLSNPERVILDKADLARIVPGRFGRGVIATTATETIFGYRVSVASAAALRVHVSALRLPLGSRLWFFGREGAVHGPTARIQDAATSDSWSQVVKGGDAFIEIVAPRSTSDVGIAFAISEIAELVALDSQGLPLGFASPDAPGDECLVDAMCSDYPVTITPFLRHAVAVINFIKNGTPFGCTGTLLNDQTSSGTPNFLTAYHCISDEATAETVVATFEYHTPFCNAPESAADESHFIAGATLMATSPDSDGTLLRLNNPLPPGRAFMGVSADPADYVPGSAALRISHPTLRPQKYAAEFLNNPQTTICFAATDFTYTYQVYGGILPGSSGSALVGDPIGAVFGQLYGVCGDPGDYCHGGYTIMDGRFDVDWIAGMSNMLYTCAPTLSVTPPPTLAEGGAGSISLGLASNCTWFADSDSTWLTLTGATQGGGGATIPFSIEPNLSAQGRCATVYVRGAPVPLCQPGAYEPEALSVDESQASGSSSNLNGVLEPGELVRVAPTWANRLTTAQTIAGSAGPFGGPAGPTYSLLDDSANYGLVGSQASADCTVSADCYLLGVSGTRPSLHWDAYLPESLQSTISPIGWTWIVHVGASFPDVPITSPFYPFVEKLLHNGITAGCGGGSYCLTSPITRAQMAVFLLKSKYGSNYSPTPYCQGLYPDVPCDDPFVTWVEEEARENITAGCGNGDYCPADPVTRAQMAVFLLKTSQGSQYTPPPCTGTVFLDVTCEGDAFDPWIEDLAVRNITGGCGGGNYCPEAANTRGQMAAFLTKMFDLKLY